MSNEESTSKSEFDVRKVTNSVLAILFAVGLGTAGLGGYQTFDEYRDAESCTATYFMMDEPQNLMLQETQDIPLDIPLEEQASQIVEATCEVDPQAQSVLRDGLGVAAIAGGAFLLNGRVVSYATWRRRREEELRAREEALRKSEGSLVSAYFGIQLGSAGRERAESQRDRAVAGSQAQPASPADNQ